MDNRNYARKRRRRRRRTVWKEYCLIWDRLYYITQVYNRVKNNDV
jgi:hypothetical protein